MRRIVQTLIFSIATSNIAYAAPAFSNELNYSAPKKSSTEKVLSNFGFNYFTKYTGRSLSDDYANGATYNRFDGGTSENGKKYDATGSTQIYQSFTLKYNLPKNMQVSYGVTYQDNLTKNVEYKQLGGNSAERSNGRSFNNHRISLWMPRIIQGSKASLSSSLYYELPTNKVTRTGDTNNIYGSAPGEIIDSKAEEYDMEFQYGIGIQPTLSIHSNIPGLHHGLTASYERYVYPDYTKSITEVPYWCRKIGKSCNRSEVTNKEYNYNLQGAKANIGAYMNYAVAGTKLTLKSSVEFDWDQVGKQVGTTDKWGNNMDNIGNLGTSYSIKSGVNLEAGVNFSLEEASLEKTSVFGSLSLSI